MNLLSIILIAIGLSMDSFAVSLTNGLTIRNLNTKRILIISFFLALFQSLMPLLGWFIGVGFEKYMQEFDHWIAFVLLAFIGLKMIYEGSFSDDKNIKDSELSLLKLLGQSIATSIDAFAVGISFAILKMDIASPVFIIGFITLLFSLLGLQLGKAIGRKIGSSVELFGGIVLIGIGVKILIEHLNAS